MIYWAVRQNEEARQKAACMEKILFGQPCSTRLLHFAKCKKSTFSISNLLFAQEMPGHMQRAMNHA